MSIDELEAETLKLSPSARALREKALGEPGNTVRRRERPAVGAGGHRAMANAVVPLRHFKEKVGYLPADEYAELVLRLPSSSCTSTSRRTASW